ncbi:stalk domain-containing protein [Paenibacillus alkalitolerans]|uniref:stalk domain-containing protein n=1 Tax=Paenibacillus alkalitolerans TaxID=2799335 RepID=UPI0018F48CF5|nr:stalk domain-containing protein [Paenibacillus alkalitolerans]
MNKLQRTAALSMLSLALVVPGVAAAEDMKGMKMQVDYSKVDVMMKNGMELVPLRTIAESLGYTVMWNGDERSISLMYAVMKDDKMMDDKMMDDKMMDNKDYTVKFSVNSDKFMAGMMEKMFSYKPVVMNGTTYVTKDFVEMYLASPAMMK